MGLQCGCKVIGFVDVILSIAVFGGVVPFFNHGAIATGVLGLVTR